MKSEWLKLYSNCIMVKGATRASICDLQRGNIHLIPMSFAELFNKNNCFHVKALIGKVHPNSKNVLKDYIDFLLENELAFYCSLKEQNQFPRISEEWLFPAHISHAVLDTNSYFDYFDSSFLYELEKLCCNHLQFRFFNKISLESVRDLLEKIKLTQIKSIEIVLPENKNEIDFYERINALVDNYRKISVLTITNAGDNKILKKGTSGIGNIIRITENINSELHCGLISQKLFSINVPTYTESINHNTCLNRKISIDTEGGKHWCRSLG